MSDIPGGDEGGEGPEANVDDTTETSHVQINVNGLIIR